MLRLLLDMIRSPLLIILFPDVEKFLSRHKNIINFKLLKCLLKRKLH